MWSRSLTKIQIDSWTSMKQWILRYRTTRSDVLNDVDRTYHIPLLRTCCGAVKGRLVVTGLMVWMAMYIDSDVLNYMLNVLMCILYLADVSIMLLKILYSCCCITIRVIIKEGQRRTSYRGVYRSNRAAPPHLPPQTRYVLGSKRRPN